MDPSDLLRRLARAPGLARLPEADRRQLIARSRIRQLARGERLFEEGDDGRSAYLVLRGSLSILRSLGAGQVTAVALRGAGEWVGELALLDGGARSASAVADSACSALEIPRDVFEALLRRHPQLGVELAAAIGRRLRESDSALIEALHKRLDTLATENRRLLRARRLGRSDESLDAAFFPGSSRAAGLFGLAPGGLPGARRARRGAIEEADGGTLYLAAIDVLPPWLQGLLVHFLRDGEYRRVGESRPRRAELRLVAASAEDLAIRVCDGRFRSDLFEAIDLLRIDVPPLRARRGDMPAVAVALLAELGAGAAEPALQLSAGALAALARRDFPGNQRELLAVFERLVEELGYGARVSPLDLARAIPSANAPEPERYSEAVRTFKRELVRSALERAGGNRTDAARILELHPSNLSRLMRNLEIEAP